MELRPTLWMRAVRPILFGSLCALVVLPLLAWLARSLSAGNASELVILGPMWALLALALSLQTWWMWSASRWRLLADGEGITLRRGPQATRIPWQQAKACAEEASPLERDGASWVTLRDGNGAVLLRWERSWFGRSRRSLRDFDLFTSFVQSQIAQG